MKKSVRKSISNLLARLLLIVAVTAHISGSLVVPLRAESDADNYDVNEPHLIINQVYGCGKDGYVSNSFIELYNPTSEAVDLKGGVLGKLHFIPGRRSC